MAKTDKLLHPTDFMIVLSGKWHEALLVAAARVECGANICKSIPAFRITSLVHLRMVSLEAALYGFLVVNNKLVMFPRISDVRWR